jgi:lipopolysaccharide export system protein LptC
MSAQPSNRLRLFFILLVFAIGALGSFWWLEILHRERGEVVGELPKGEPDYSVEKFNLVRMAKDGHVRYSISGTKLTHYPDNDSFEIDKPVLYNVGKSHTPMTMRSDTAVIEHATNKVHMHHHVQADRAVSEQNARFHLATDYLLLLPDDDTIETDKHVDIVYGQSQLSGIGMMANNTTREFSLLHRVHGTFITPSAQ